MRHRREWLVSLLVIALLCAGLAVKDALLAPPAVAPESEFDSHRAIARLQRILGDERPHPVDSAANDLVRERLIRELRAVGLAVAVRETMDCSAMPKSRAVSCARVRNVVATVPGRSAGKHLLLNAHYDSTPTGPGAADDGMGVAVLLEVAAILRAAPPPRPVTFLFNEGEEFGLNGAAAFVRDDPLAKQVNSLINIEARGVSGPALMFETSDPNGAAIALYASSTRRPYANSMSMDFAKLIPNTTDVVKFRPSGWTLLNYSIIGNETRYHTPGDTVAALDRSSFAHIGTEVLAATRAFAAMPDPAQAGSGRQVFTDVAGRAFIRLPVIIAAGALAVLLLLAILLAWRRGALGRPLLLAAAMMAGGAAAAGLTSFLATIVRPGDFYRAYPLVTYLAVYAVLLAAMTAIWARWGADADRGRMRAATWLFILFLGAALSLAIPGASIFFLIAPAAGLLAAALTERAPRASGVLAAIAAVGHFLFFAELLALVEMLLVDGPLWAVAPLGAIAVLPALVECNRAACRTASPMLLVASAGLWIAALSLPRSSDERPAAFSIDYFLDAENKAAKWAIASKQAPLPKELTGRWEKQTLPYNMRTRWVSDAPIVAAPMPSVRVISTSPAGSGRRVRLMLAPGAGANTISVRFVKGAAVRSLGLPGAPIPLPATGEPSKPVLRCSGRSCAGLVVEAVFENRKPVSAEIYSTRPGLPPQGAAVVEARPRNAIPQYSPDQTITRGAVSF